MKFELTFSIYGQKIRRVLGNLKLSMFFWMIKKRKCQIWNNLFIGEATWGNKWYVMTTKKWRMYRVEQEGWCARAGYTVIYVIYPLHLSKKIYIHCVPQVRVFRILSSVLCLYSVCSLGFFTIATKLNRNHNLTLTGIIVIHHVIQNYCDNQKRC